MSTRSIVGTFDLDTGEFRGRYVHSDGYPTGRAPVLANLLARLDGDLERLVATVTEQTGGWACLQPNYSRNSLGARGELIEPFGLAYRDNEDDEWITGTFGEHFDDVFIEWGYFFTGTDPATAALIVSGFPCSPSGPAGALAVIPVRLLHTLTDQAWELIEASKYSGEEETPNYGVNNLDLIRRAVTGEQPMLAPTDTKAIDA